MPDLLSLFPPGSALAEDGVLVIGGCRVDELAAGAVDAGLSRGLVGVSGSTLVVNLASSRAAVRDGMATLTPLVGHVIAELSGLD